MNQQLARRLRKLEEKHAQELNRNVVYRIVWATAGRPRGLGPLRSEAVLDSSEGPDPPALDNGGIRDDS